MDFEGILTSKHIVLVYCVQSEWIDIVKEQGRGSITWTFLYDPTHPRKLVQPPGNFDGLGEDHVFHEGSIS